MDVDVGFLDGFHVGVAGGYSAACWVELDLWTDEGVQGGNMGNGREDLQPTPNFGVKPFSNLSSLMNSAILTLNSSCAPFCVSLLS